MRRAGRKETLGQRLASRRRARPHLVRRPMPNHDYPIPWRGSWEQRLTNKHSRSPANRGHALSTVDPYRWLASGQCPYLLARPCLHALVSLASQQGMLKSAMRAQQHGTILGRCLLSSRSWRCIPRLHRPVQRRTHLEGMPAGYLDNGRQLL